MRSALRTSMVVGIALLLAGVAGADTHTGDWDVTGEITASGNFATFGDSSYVTPFSGWSGSSRMVAVRQPTAVSTGVSSGFMFSNNQTSGAFKNIAQLMFINEASALADKRVAQILVQTGGNINSGKMFFRVYDSGSATDALVINRFGGTTVKFADGYTQTAAFMGATSGGSGNTAAASNATVGGGYNNTAGNDTATVAGGNWNTATGSTSTVGGGYQNYATALQSTIAGGGRSTAGGLRSAVGGGYYNDAQAAYATIAGGGPVEPISDPTGTNNDVTDEYGTIGGGGGNQVGDGVGTTQDAWYSTVAGGSGNIAGGDYSLAAGRDANIAAAHDGTFLWANEFAARATGGVRFVTAVTGSGVPTAGVTLAGGGGSWSSISARNAKENFKRVDGRDVLAKVAAMPIETWNYKTQDDSFRHIGPMAGDFRAAFGVGDFEKRITAIDADGVALAAIQGLNQRLEEKDTEIQMLKARLAALEEAIAKE